ncbi:MAG TPA: LysR family transcriptional regulator [Dongiaceae bacterium]|nr:LysR family transcriptional regulator [Dongiaceae bacterium]
MFSLLQFRAFVAVADTRSVRLAAEQLHRTPSAVSMMLSQLEERVGAPLFESGRKGQLTELGQFVLEEARSLIDHDERVARGIRSFAEGQLGRLDVACIPSIANVFLPQTLSHLWARSPNMIFHVRDMDSRSVVEMVATEKVEIGFGVAVDLGDDMDFMPLFDDPIDVVCGPKDDLIKAPRPLAWSSLLSKRLLGNSSYTAIPSPELRALAERQAAYIPNITSLLALVRSGFGITILPRINTLQAAGTVAFLPLEDPAAKRRVGCIRKANRSLTPGAINFIAALKAVLEKSAVTHDITLL